MGPAKASHSMTFGYSSNIRTESRASYRLSDIRCYQPQFTWQSEQGLTRMIKWNGAANVLLGKSLKSKKILSDSKFRRRRTWVSKMKNNRRLFSLVIVLLSACSGLTSPMATSANGVSVSLHGVNYTDRPFQYVVIDPKNPSNSGGGEHIAPFSAGGIVCCYRLPKQWLPGMTVQVRATYWLPKDDHGKSPEVTKDYIVEVPKYANDEVGEFWVLRTKDGNIEVVSSNFQPNHPNWPGKVKGWPEPSLEYQRERWAVAKNDAEMHVRNYLKLIDELENAPQQRSQKSWNFAAQYNKEEIARFKSFDDPAYLEYLKSDYAEGLKSSGEELKEIMKRKP